MRAYILAGGRGTRIQEESATKPKPLIEACDKPLIWHIMKNFQFYGIDDFGILAGYKFNQFNNFVNNYWQYDDYNFFNKSQKESPIKSNDFSASVYNTGLTTNTGGRILRVKDEIKGTFLLTYGDSVSDVNIDELIKLHRKSNCIVTLTAVKPIPRFGSLVLDETKVTSFKEKEFEHEEWINGGFMVCEPEILELIQSDECILETDVLPLLASSGNLSAYKHEGYWHAIDTLRDLLQLENDIEMKKLPWAL